MKNANDSSLRVQRKPWYLAVTVLVLLCMFCFRFIPASGAMTQVGMGILGVFIGAVIGWIFLDIGWVSIVALLAMGFTGYCDCTTAIANGLKSSTTTMLFAILFFCAAVSLAGIDKWMANKILTLKFVHGHPWAMTMIIFVGSMVMTLLMGVGPAIVLVWFVFQSMVKTMGVTQNSKWVRMVMFGIPYCGAVVYLWFPFRPLCATVIGQYETLSGGDTLMFGPYLIWQIVVSAVSLVLFLLFCRYIYKPDTSEVKNATSFLEFEEPALTAYQKFILGFFLFVVVALLIPSLAPKGTMLYKIFNTFGSTGIATLGFVVLLILSFKDGPSLRDLITHKSIKWDMMFMIIALMSLSGAIKDDATGITSWFVELLSPLCQGKSGVALILVLVVTCALMTQVCNNNATAAVFTPIAYSLAVAAGGSVNMQALMMCIIGAANVAFITPAGCNPAAMLMAQKDWVDMKTCVGFGVLVFVINIIASVGVGVPLAMALF